MSEIIICVQRNKYIHSTRLKIINFDIFQNNKSKHIYYTNNLQWSICVLHKNSITNHNITEIQTHCSIISHIFVNLLFST